VESKIELRRKGDVQPESTLMYGGRLMEKGVRSRDVQLWLYSFNGTTEVVSLDRPDERGLKVEIKSGREQCIAGRWSDLLVQMSFPFLCIVASSFDTIDTDLYSSRFHSSDDSIIKYARTTITQKWNSLESPHMARTTQATQLHVLTKIYTYLYNRLIYLFPNNDQPTFSHQASPPSSA
jgi:hypothetical protein